MTPARPEIDRGQGWDDAIARAKAIVDGKTKGNAPGAVKAVELLELARSTDITDAPRSTRASRPRTRLLPTSS